MYITSIFEYQTIYACSSFNSLVHFALEERRTRTAIYDCMTLVILILGNI